MISSYHTLAWVASSLDSKLAGTVIESAFSQEKDELAMTFHGFNEALLISCRKVVHTLFLHPRFARAKANSADVLKGCREKGVEAVYIHPSDRVIVFRLGGGLALHALLFGSRPNVLLVDGDGTVVDAFHNARILNGTRRAIPGGELVYDAEKLRLALHDSPERRVEAIVKQAFPTLGSIAVKDLLDRATVSPAVIASRLIDPETASLVSSFISVVNDLGRPRFLIYIDEATDRPKQFSLFPLHHLGQQHYREFADIHEAIRFFVSRQRAVDTFEEKKRESTVKLRHHLAKTRRSLAASEADLGKSNRADDYQRFGNLLMNNLVSIPSGAEEARLFDDHAEVVVPLHAALTPIQNAQTYFEKAKRARVAHEESKRRVDTLRAMAGRGEKLLNVLELTNSRNDLQRVMSDYADEIEEFGLGAEGKRREELPFRIFEVDGGFEVLAGKSSSNNDLLTMKYAKPKDLWFHARGGSGSHVVLKCGSGNGEPGRKAREQAAAIAAYYSKMKNAKMVPVAMTEKKYVRKPKGAPAGTVVIEREKIIFVEPRLPGNTK